MPTCYIMVGLPGAGKSTFINNKLNNIKVHSSDNIIEDFAKAENKTYNDVFSDYIGQATAIFKQNVKDSIQNNETFIVDRTNLTKKSRRSIISQLPKSYEVVAIVIEVTSYQLQQNLNNRSNKTIPPSVIENFKNIFEFPTFEEGFDRIVHIKKD